MLHPGFANKDADLLSQVFGIPQRILHTWARDSDLWEVGSICKECSALQNPESLSTYDYECDIW